MVLATGLGLCTRVSPACAQQQARVDRDSVAGDRRADERLPLTTGRTRTDVGVGGPAKAIMVDSLIAPSVRDLSNVLSSRVPGVLVERPSGVTGAGSRIHIRGISSLVLSGDPLLIVDGMWVDDATTFSTATGDGQATSRFDDLDPDAIERIEVLSGPATAALFGGDAAEGVILITTRRGRPGRPRWRLHTAYGISNDRTSYPANYARPGTDPATGLPVVSCTLDMASLGLCVPGELRSWNPLEEVNPFHTGSQQQHGLSVQGGNRVASYYAAADYNREHGVYADNDRQLTHVRANLTSHLGRALGFTLTSAYVDGTVRLPATDEGGIVGAGLFGKAADDPVTRGYTDTLSNVLHEMGPPERMHHSMVGFNANWRPASWWRMTGTVGFDRVHLSSNERRVYAPLDRPPGDSTVQRMAGAYRSDALTVRAELEASYGHTAALSASSSFGVLYNRRRVYDRHESEMVEFREDPASTLTNSFTTDLRAEPSAAGAYVTQRIAWRDRLFLTAGLRREQPYRALLSSGSRPPGLNDAAASLSWVVSSEPFFPRTGWLDALHLRAAYGSTARFLDGAIVSPGVLESTVLHVSAALGPRSPTSQPIPERTRELEAGLDATLFDGRLDAALTYYDKRSMHLAAITLFPTSVGAPTGRRMIQDAGAIQNRGYEMRLRASLLRGHAVSWDVTATGATNRNRFSESNIPPNFPAFPQGAVPGYPVGGYWNHGFTFTDANGDGIIARDEVHLADTMAFVGGAVPTRELSIAPVLRLGDRIELSALFDYRGGFTQYNWNAARRCRDGAASTCSATYDPATSLAEQAAAVADWLGADAGYIEDGDFWKLREVAVALTAPGRWSRWLAARDVRLTLAGRNLATWTSYSGLDPEINAFPSDPIRRADIATQPPVRYLTARLDVTW